MLAAATRRDVLTLLATALALVASASSSCRFLPTTGTLTDVVITGGNDTIIDAVISIDNTPGLWSLDDTAAGVAVTVTIETDELGAASAPRLGLSLFALDNALEAAGGLEPVRREIDVGTFPDFADEDDGIPGNIPGTFVTTLVLRGDEIALVECGSFPCESRFEIAIDVDAAADFAALADVRLDAINETHEAPLMTVALSQRVDE